VPTGYDINLTVLSLLAAIVVTSFGLGVAIYSPAKSGALIGGGIVGAGVAAMHYLGVCVLQIPDNVVWSLDLVTVSILLGMLFGIAALAVAVRHDDVTATCVAALLLTLAIVSHHFTAMGAIEIVPDPARVVEAASLSPISLALAIAVIAVAVLCMSFAGAFTDRRFRENELRLNTAVNNMSQGLLMFDSSARLVLCNNRYFEMYGLSSKTVKPGGSLRDLLYDRIAVGTFTGDPEQYAADLLRAISEGNGTSAEINLPDGRIIVVRNQPTQDGGWVSTHEDITELREQKLQLDTALNNMTQGLNLFDSEGRLVLSNGRYIEMYGLSPELVRPGCTVGDLVAYRVARGTFFSADAEKYTEDLLVSMAQRKSTSTKLELSDGRVIFVVNQPVAGGGWVVTHEDITDRYRSEKELERTRNFLDAVIEHVPAAIVVKDARDLRFLLINRAGEENFGISRGEAIGKTVYDIFETEFAAAIADNDMHSLRSRGPQFYSEHPVQTPGKGTRVVTSTRVPIPGDDGEPRYLVTVVHDITERKEAEARIAHMAHHDALTDLPNRVAFSEHLAFTLERAATSKANFAVLCIDLDRFKEVNDIFGHSVGDALLHAFSRRLHSAAEQAFFARLGGDEFTLIAEGPQPSSAEALAERLLAVVADDFDIAGHQLRIGLSVGVAIFPTDGADAITLMGNADAALYRAKAEGRGTIRFFAAEMDKRLRERRSFQHDLRTAIVRRELALNYQPQALIGGKVIGFEALARWHHPTRGLVPPNTFIPIAEESGLIISIGEWILWEACREAASWPRPLQIAVNLSPIQFRHGDLAGLVHTILLETGLAAHRLELEITEGVLIGDFSRAVSILRRLKTLGVRISMDDFGTGYSSLSYLQSFPFDKIKIDQSFILNVNSNAQSAAIVRTIIGLGRALHLPVVAEGVETKEQQAFLAHELCDEVQGFLIGRPRPIEDYSAIVGRAATDRPGAVMVG
jgi:diguanylate cyclase (GGDEF)-like protein/PAS domain S-box-containing protein